MCVIAKQYRDRNSLSCVTRNSYLGDLFGAKEEYIGEINKERKKKGEREREIGREGRRTKDSKIERAGAKREERDMITFSVSVVLGVAQHEC